MRAYEEACEQNQKRPLAALICAAENRSSVSFNLSATKPVHCFHYKHIQDVVSELTELQELTLRYVGSLRFDVFANKQLH